MKKIKYLLIFSLFIVLLISCKKNDTSIKKPVFSSAKSTLTTILSKSSNISSTKSIKNTSIITTRDTLLSTTSKPKTTRSTKSYSSYTTLPKTTTLNNVERFEYENFIYTISEDRTYITIINVIDVEIDVLVIPSEINNIPVKAVSISKQIYSDNPIEIYIPSSIEMVGKLIPSYPATLKYNEYNGGLYLGNDQNPYLVLSSVYKDFSGNLIVHEDTKIISINAFENINNIDLYIGKNVSYIAPGAISYRSDLSSITVDELNAKYDSRNNCNAVIETASNTLCQGSSCSVIPDTVTSIGSGAFSSSYIEEIKIPSSVLTIESDAFSYSNLIYIEIPSNVKAIGKSAFMGCRKLIDVYIEEGLETIEEYAFGFIIYSASDRLNIPNDRMVSIPSSIKEIKDYAFINNKLNSLILPGTLEFIGNYAFQNVSLEHDNNVVIPSSVELIGDYAFDTNYANINLTLNKNLKYIGIHGFTNVSNLKFLGNFEEYDMITMPNEVRTMFNKLDIEYIK